MEPRVTAAIIGCGRMGAFTSEGVRRFAPPCWFPLSHAEAIRAHPALELTGFADASEAALHRALEAYAGTRGFPGHAPLLAALRPALLSVATRTPGRAGIILDGLAAGVRAFHVEKPLCSSRRELEALAAAFGGGQRFLTLGTVRRHFGVYGAARALVDSGVLGPLKEITVSLGHGALYWTHPHSVDLILFFGGERPLSAVQARLGNVEFGASRDVVRTDPSVEWATLQFADGVTGHITRAPGCDVVLSCAKGQVLVASDGRALRVAQPAGDDAYFSWHDESLPPAAGPQGTWIPIDQLARCLRGEPQAQADNARLRQDIFTGQRALFALVQSHLMDSRLLPLEQADAPLTIEARTGDNCA